MRKKHVCQRVQRNEKKKKELRNFHVKLSPDVETLLISLQSHGYFTHTHISWKLLNCLINSSNLTSISVGHCEAITSKREYH